MGDAHVETLKKARENFVRKRRVMAAQMVPPGAAAQHFAPAFADLQAAIEALDRAIMDEEALPIDYAPDESEPESAVVVEMTPLSDHDPA